MNTALIAHGINGTPSENWFPWLQKKLEARNMSVLIPHFPTKNNLSFEDWWTVFAKYEERLSSKSILIGHSLGVAFLLKVIEVHPIRSAFFVAPAWGVTNNEFDPIIEPISAQQFDWESIQRNCPYFSIFHSENDPYLSMEGAETLSSHLSADLTIVPDAGHFNTVAGYKRFPALLEKIEMRCNT